MDLGNQESSQEKDRPPEFIMPGINGASVSSYLLAEIKPAFQMEENRGGQNLNDLDTRCKCSAEQVRALTPEDPSRVPPIYSHTLIRPAERSDTRSWRRLTIAN